MLVTAVVQSSSAVTVATIGFVNAGLLTLAPALWVLFGANVGTTMTGWIVALVGLKFKIDGLALPLIGIGVVMRLTGQGQRRGAVGTTLAGFGLLFLGISMLQQGFAGVAATATLPTGQTALGVAAQVATGVVMTVLMQSSSASMAVALTAAQGGLLDTQGAAAVVIGANIGTTFTAVLAAIGATSNARRVAAAHVAFNVLTGGVAFALLPWLVQTIELARDGLALPADPAATLALFHTVFNVLGVVLMWPLAGALAHWLQARFRAREEDEAQPRHLDTNALAVPALAVEALASEVARITQISLRAARATLAEARPEVIAPDLAIVSALATAAEQFAERVNRGAMSPAASARLAQVLRLLRYAETVAEQARQASTLPPAGEGAVVQGPLQTFQSHADTVLDACGRWTGAASLANLDESAQAMEQAYQTLKAALLSAGADGRLRIVAMERALRRYSALRRAAEQALKAARLDRQLASPSTSGLVRHDEPAG